MPITIAKIAELCGVSRGTVDRALNNKGNVRPEVCERIKRVAEEQGYRPNRAGRALVRTRDPIRIGVIVHSAPTAFMQTLLYACQAEAAEAAGLGVQVIFRTMKGMDPEDMVLKINDLVENEHVGGLAISPLAHVHVQQALTRVIDELHIPVVTFNSDLPAINRLCYVGQDNIAAGRTAAGLLGLLLGHEPATVLVITGSTTVHQSYNERVFGFCNELSLQFPNLTQLAVQNCEDRVDLAEQIVLDTLERVPELSGIYIASTGYEGVCRALTHTGMQRKIRVIAHDLVAHNLVMARRQVLDFVLGQDAQSQGALPIRYLREFLLDGKQPEPAVQYTDIEVKFHYNITERDCADAEGRTVSLHAES